MAITPSFGDYPDFGNPSGAQSVALTDNQAFGAGTNNVIGTFDTTMYRTLRLNVSVGGAVGVGYFVQLNWRSNVQGGTTLAQPLNCAVTPAFVTVSMPVLGPSVEIRVISSNGVTNISGTITITATVAPVACHVPGLLIEGTGAALAPFAVARFTPGLVVSGAGFIAVETGGAMAARAILEQVDAVGVWHGIMAATTEPPHWGFGIACTVPPSHVRLAVQNLGAAAQDVAGHITIA